MKLPNRRRPFPFRQAHIPVVGLSLLTLASGQASAQDAGAKQRTARVRHGAGPSLATLSEPSPVTGLTPAEERPKAAPAHDAPKPILVVDQPAVIEDMAPSEYL